MKCLQVQYQSRHQHQKGLLMTASLCTIPPLYPLEHRPNDPFTLSTQAQNYLIHRQPKLKTIYIPKFKSIYIINARKGYSCVLVSVQVSPLHQLGHTQMNPLTSSVQVPPFWQGLVEQSLMLTSQFVPHSTHLNTDQTIHLHHQHKLKTIYIINPSSKVFTSVNPSSKVLT